MTRLERWFTAQSYRVQVVFALSLGVLLAALLYLAPALIVVLACIMLATQPRRYTR
jgi:hypothetical protein